MKYKYFVLSMLFLNIYFLSFSQSFADSNSWKRNEETEELKPELFHSTHAINLPTTETLTKGILEFEISHRFIPPVADGFKELYGFDGPANMRFGFGYAINSRMILTLARSNVFDNVDLQLKYRLPQFRSGRLPLALAVVGGLGWNMADFPNRSQGDARNFQYYAQLVINGMIGKKIGIGIVPSYLYNSDIFSAEYENVVTLGSYFQYYHSALLSFMAEWNADLSKSNNSYNVASFGIELETGGHFFKLFLTNSVLLNPSQNLSGSVYPFRSDEWRLGFLITRLLKL